MYAAAAHSGGGGVRGGGLRVQGNVRSGVFRAVDLFSHFLFFSPDVVYTDVMKPFYFSRSHIK